MTAHSSRPVAAFADHFASRSTQYARYRPTYPASLGEYLAGSAPGRALAWDCGTGSGQATGILAPHFDLVVASDLSAAQLSQAKLAPNVRYVRAREVCSSLRGGVADLVTAAQAAHWFDLPAFYQEVRRVLRDGGLLALWSYGRLHVEGPAQEVLDWFRSERLGRYWPAQRSHVDNGYRSLPFPFERISAPDLRIEAELDLGALAGYAESWSAVARCREAEGADPVVELMAALRPLWGDGPRAVWWPLSILLGRPTR